MCIPGIRDNGHLTLSGSSTLSRAETVHVANATQSFLTLKDTSTFTLTGGYAVVGANGGAGAIYQSGGTLTTNYGVTAIGESGTGWGVYNMTGGIANIYTVSGAWSVNLGDNNSATGIINLSGTAHMTLGNTVYVGTRDTATGIINLGAVGSSGDASILTVKDMGRYESTPTGLLNFHGGTLQANADSSALLASSNALTATYIYSEGAKIDTNGHNVTINTLLSAPGGNGVTNIPVTGGGSGYIDAPVVQISGGGGTGATAVATISGGVVTGITITNPGTGYTGTPTATLAGGGGSGYTLGTIATAANASSGGLTKLGSGTLTLTAANNWTSAGALDVKGGTVNFDNSSASYNFSQWLIGDQTGTGVVNISNGSQTLLGSIKHTIGENGAAGAVYQTGGAVTYTSDAGGDMEIGRDNSASSGYYALSPGATLNGGVHNLLISAAGTGMFNQTGGSVTFTGGLQVYGGNYGLYSISAGAANFAPGTSYLVLFGGATSQGIFSVSGTGNLTLGKVAVGMDWTSGSAATGIMNVGTTDSPNGGTLAMNYMENDTTGGAIVNFHGGTLKAAAASTDFLKNTTNYVYNEGAVIDTNGNDVTITSALLDAGAAGSGVTSIGVTGGGSGYISPPAVVITGGGGTGATAVATISSGAVTGITITNPGTGYTGTPTVTLAGGAPTVAATLGPATTGVNASGGGLTKLDPGQLTFTGDLTYTGTTDIQEGLLQINTPTTTATPTLAAVTGAGDLGVGDGVNPTTLKASSVSVHALTIGARSETRHRAALKQRCCGGSTRSRTEHPGPVGDSRHSVCLV